MNEQQEDAKLNGNTDDRVLVIMLILCFALVMAVVAVNIIHAPKFEEPVFTADADASDISSVGGAYNSSAEAAESGESFPIRINFAGLDELQKIPGIGPVTAQKIIDFRDENGTIVEFSDLLAIDGIGEKTVETIAEYCIID